jgi:hypothetical protein
MAQSFIKVLALQGNKQKLTTTTASSSTNPQVAASLNPLSCAFCGQSGHFIAQCLVCTDYITNEKYKKGIQRERLYFSMDSLLRAAFPVGLSKTESTNGTSVTPLHPLLLLSCMKLTQCWHRVKPVLLPT